MRFPCPIRQKGFTLVEMLVVMTIIGILFAVGIARYQVFNRNQILTQAAEELKNNLRLAQQKALAGEKPAISGFCTDPGDTLASYRLKFIPSGLRYNIKAICSDGSVQPNDFISYNLPENVTGPGGQEVLFKVLGQGIDANSQVTFTLTYSGVGIRNVTVTRVGKIE